jgi:energy-converting hydrogenase Eha subunit E
MMDNLFTRPNTRPLRGLRVTGIAAGRVSVTPQKPSIKIMNLVIILIRVTIFFLVFNYLFASFFSSLHARDFLSDV